MALLQTQGVATAVPLANLRVPRGRRAANHQAVAMWRCCACGHQWRALPHGEKEECCAFAPCVLSFSSAEAAPAHNPRWAVDHDALCKAISNLEVDENCSKQSTTGESCSDDLSQGDEETDTDNHVVSSDDTTPGTATPARRG
mmetsp:Transcript_26120/g.66568  ORF Transcript_26120/g.66568 Transcript_26120/m.66568 type:complete len:143 (-) Transcript_26120:365-793(-)